MNKVNKLDNFKKAAGVDSILRTNKAPQTEGVVFDMIGAFQRAGLDIKKVTDELEAQPAESQTKAKIIEMAAQQKVKTAA